MYSPLVSIIIPVYNVEKYLEECLESLKTQTYRNIEVILVDDGSKDRSGEICDGYARQDKRFISIHQKNSGVSRARNHGLEIASGEWVLFVDSDDWVDPDYVAGYVNSIEEGVDLIYGGYKSFGDVRMGLQGYTYSNMKFLVSRLSEALPFILIYCTPWGKLYKREVIVQHKLKFDERLSMSEDRLFLYQYLSYINCVHFISYTGYNYRVSTASLMNRQHPKEEVLLKKKSLWYAACDIKTRWNLSLEQFVPLYIIHSRDVIDALGMNITKNEKKVLYQKTIEQLFPKEYYRCNKEERASIKKCIDKDIFFSSFGYNYAVGVRMLLRINNKLHQIIC